ncbi:endonuclease/exonuclease/phosphatase family protein [Bacillus sp. 3255]|uniref:endonuclease/exonuclease/phosphatase family protein n=1 Tax=Bacillus sp. 3255 TaxID=2817904 RepID=UPI002858511B|nr:endonuclease/exonuclease/phosphatase family protein [Bacillus sp. 3255]MDR6878761.1 endonuclease/exonuclease/phosphatase family metal-dependent hydrolase [Bacillus sp. 3255]
MAVSRTRLARFAGLFVLFYIISAPNADIGRGYSSALSKPAALAQASSLTIMTFNMRHGQGMDDKVELSRIADLIRESRADVIALQEVDRFRLRSGFVDQAEELAKMLGMDMRFAPSLTYTVGQYGNAILSRYPILDSSWTLLPGSKERRSLLTATVKIGSEEVHVATTHLGLSQEDRKLQLSRIADVLTSTEGLLVVAGDFNMEEDAFPLKMNRINIMSVPLGQTEHGTFADGATIDYIFTNLPNAGSAWTIRTNVSDHDPVIARVELGSAARV